MLVFSTTASSTIVPRGIGVSAAAIGYVSPTTDVRVTTPLVLGFEMSSIRRRWRMLTLWR